MAQNTRQDRLRMRQRGAGRQNVNTNDFGLVFGSIETKRRSATPQSVRSSGRRSVQRSRDSSAARSVRQGSIVAERTDQDGPSMAKRRKLTAGTVLNVTSTPGVASGGQDTDASARRSRRRTGGRQVEISVAEEGAKGAIEEVRQEDDEVQSALSALGWDERDELDKENVGSTGPKKKRKKRVSVGQGSRRKKRSSNSSLRDVSVNVQPAMMDRSVSGAGLMEDEANEGQPAPEENHQLAATIEPEEDEEVESQQGLEEAQEPISSVEDPHSCANSNEFTQAPSERSTQKRKKRKSIVQKTRKRRSSQTHDRGHPSPPINDFVGQDDEQDETYMEDDDDAPEPPTPAAVSKKGRKQARKRSRSSTEDDGERTTSAQPQAKKSKKAPVPTIPITVHRLTLPSTSLAPILEESEPDSSDDLTTTTMPTRNSKQPNAIDVLSQIAHEHIDAATANLQHSSLPAKERKQQLTALTSFRHTLSAHLMNMSTTLDHRLTLEARVRQSKREKMEMQARWREVRAQREQVALECDAVRREAWELDEEGKRGYELSTKVYQLESTLERDTSQEEGVEARTGTAFLAKTVRNDVCGTADGGGGMLTHVQEFNALLEGLLRVLDADGDAD